MYVRGEQNSENSGGEPESQWWWGSLQQRLCEAYPTQDNLYSPVSCITLFSLQFTMYTQCLKSTNKLTPKCSPHIEKWNIIYTSETHCVLPIIFLYHSPGVTIILIIVLSFSCYYSWLYHFCSHSQAIDFFYYLFFP